jgi:hypothetical protein
MSGRSWPPTRGWPFPAPGDTGQSDEPRLLGQIEQMIAAGDLDAADTAAK